MPTHPKTNKISKLKQSENRPSSNIRGYDSSWRVVRKYHLDNNPLCHDCLTMKRYTPGQDIHHKIKLKDRPDLRDDPNNLMTLCHSCHSVRTAKGE